MPRTPGAKGGGGIRGARPPQAQQPPEECDGLLLVAEAEAVLVLLPPVSRLQGAAMHSGRARAGRQRLAPVGHMPAASAKSLDGPASGGPGQGPQAVRLGGLHGFGWGGVPTCQTHGIVAVRGQPRSPLLGTVQGWGGTTPTLQLVGSWRSHPRRAFTVPMNGSCRNPASHKSSKASKAQNPRIAARNPLDGIVTPGPGAPSSAAPGTYGPGPRP